jgi:hypothetical protein
MQLVARQPTSKSSISETEAVNDWSQHAAYDLFIKLQGLAIVVKLITVWGSRQAEPKSGLCLQDS